MAQTRVQESPNGAASSVNASKIVVRQFRVEDREAVGAIFVDGFPTHFGEEAEMADAYIKSCLESDLADVFGTYMNRGGNFWVATLENDIAESQVVGMVALEKKGGGEGELRRMSIKKEFRRFGVGKLLVSELEQWAKADGYETILLWTGEEMKVAQKFYSAIGYKKKSERAIPEDPNFIVFEFVKQL